MEEQKIQNLLKNVQSKIDLYEKHKELSGENFNIFSIMGMESDEVYTHSAIIAELLNPKGSHGLGSKPLELFINPFIDENFFFDCQNASCIKEQFIGKINEDQTEGGRLDIVVKNNIGQIFVIENKIYAFEQHNQLLRYRNKYPYAKIFYLTLFGNESRQIKSEENAENEFYTSVSYKTTIIEWLENCVPFAYNKPMVREILNQYIYLIKKLTNQTTNKQMKNEIIELIKCNFNASEEIYKNYKNAVISAQRDFLILLKNELEKVSIENPNWCFLVEYDSKNNENLLYLKNEIKDLKMIFRINKFNEAAVRIIDYCIDEKKNLIQLNEELTDIMFIKSKLNPKNVHHILERNISHQMITLNEGQTRIDGYSKKLTDILKILSKL